jgi:hypothetical protein
MITDSDPDDIVLIDDAGHHFSVREQNKQYRRELRREKLLYILGVPAFFGLMIGSIMGIGALLNFEWVM